MKKWEMIKEYIKTHKEEVLSECRKAEITEYQCATENEWEYGLDILVYAEFDENSKITFDWTFDYKDVSQELPEYIIYKVDGVSKYDAEEFIGESESIEEAIDGRLQENDYIEKIYDTIEDGEMTEEEWIEKHRMDNIH